MLSLSFFFFFNDTATTEIYTLSLHDALPIFRGRHHARRDRLDRRWSTHQRRGNRPARRAGGGRHARDRLAGGGKEARRGALARRGARAGPWGGGGPGGVWDAGGGGRRGEDVGQRSSGA